ncbi:MAG: hypothetical protein LUE17_11145 [Planctomycetaceae bacterium]|nr:hypothetical protein [Planctomycetaceae bacterium]
MHEAIITNHPGAVDDPAAFARSVLRLEPTAQQAEFFGELAKPGARVAVRSGHGTGKSTALAVAALWFLSTRRDALVPCTAPTAHQLQDVLWRELRRLITRLDDACRAWFLVTSDRITLKNSGGMIVARTARPENPDALQGFHAPEILFVIDEAAGVNDVIFEVARGALSTPSARVALTGNPTRLSGYFHNAFHGARNTWARLVFSCLDSPLVAPDYAAEIAQEYGEDSDVYRVRVLGEFLTQGFHNLISLEMVDRAMERTAPPFPPVGAARIFGVDPAWLGPDRSAVVFRQGRVANVLFSVRGADTSRLAEMVARRAEELRPDAIFVDQTGVGAGVLDQIKRLGFNALGVAFAGKPLEPERFLNKRAEIWWAMREWIEKDAVLEPNRELRDDLITPEYSYTYNGKIQLEGKDAMRRRGHASPDLADALALTFAMPVYPRTAGSAVVNAARHSNLYEWMERN